VVSSLPAQLQTQRALSVENADQRGAYIFANSAVTGMVMVVVRNHEVIFRSYGETFPGSNHKPDANSLVRLCSIAKVLTGDLLVRLNAEGKLRLDDPLQRFAPQGKIVPTRAGARPITLRDLATHTSGLPREVGPYPQNVPHFTFPDKAYRWNWLQHRRLITPPGTAALYSNVGFDFLGDALASAAGEPYAQLLRERIVRPLALRDTTLAPTADQCSQLLRGTGDEGPCTDTQASGASGGVYSTPTDMARLMQSMLQIPGMPAQPSPALDVDLRPSQLRSMNGLSHAGDPSGIGLAWIQLGDPAGPSTLLEKTGGGAGFTIYIALSLKRHTGIFLAVTDGTGRAHIDFYHEANTLLADLAAVPPLPPKVHTNSHHAKRRLHHRRGPTAHPS
jgi:D-alanyl-D-alanine-carboxypeptidase/D-alanyl-D-alanine-endopeptidase